MKILRKKRIGKYVGLVDDVDPDVSRETLHRVYSDEISLPDFKFCLRRHNILMMVSKYSADISWARMCLKRLGT